MIIGGSGSGKTNTLLNLINEQDDIDKIYLHAKDLSKPKYEYLIKKRRIQTHLSSVKIQWMMFMKISMITIQAQKEKS